MPAIARAILVGDHGLSDRLLGNLQVKSFRYRLAAKRMERERRKYVNFTVPYTVGLGENRGYELFVENIEQVLQDEGAVTSNKPDAR